MFFPRVVCGPTDMFLLTVQHRLKPQAAKALTAEGARHNIDRICRWIVDSEKIDLILAVGSGSIGQGFSHSAVAAKNNTAFTIPSGLDLNSVGALPSVEHQIIGGA